MSPARRVAVGIAGGATVIAVVTLLARITGFGRWLVFSRTVGDTCLGTAYSTANMLPNIVFEVVAGGALASAVVPLVTGAMARGDVAASRRTAAALMTWSMAVLVPVAVAGMLLAEPVMALLVGDPAGCSTADTTRVAAAMFVVFAPQVVLYGFAVVSSGVLNSHRRFLAPALAPLLSSIVVAGAYVGFAATYAGSRDDLAAVSSGALRWLSFGTTGGVAVLMLATLLPAVRLGAIGRPTFRFPPGAAARARGLAGAGLAALVAQQVATLVVIVVANSWGGGGALNIYNFTWAVYLLPYAVLAVPIATAAFTVLSEHAGRAETAAFADTAARTTRAVVVASWLGAAVLAGSAVPVARAFAVDPPGPMAWALVAFAPGLVGYGLVAHLGRALYARGAGRAAGTPIVGGWLVAAAGTALAGPLLATAIGPRAVVAGIGAATSLGMLLAAGWLLVSLRRHAGPATLAGLPRTGTVAGAGALVGAAAGAALGVILPPGGFWLSTVEAAACAAVATGCVAVAVLVGDGEDLRTLLSRRSARG